MWGVKVAMDTKNAMDVMKMTTTQEKKQSLLEGDEFLQGGRCCCYAATKRAI
jgi:hypothetical protein